MLKSLICIVTIMSLNSFAKHNEISYFDHATNEVSVEYFENQNDFAAALEVANKLNQAGEIELIETHDMFETLARGGSDGFGE